MLCVLVTKACMFMSWQLLLSLPLLENLAPAFNYVRKGNRTPAIPATLVSQILLPIRRCPGSLPQGTYYLNFVLRCLASYLSAAQGRAAASLREPESPSSVSSFHLNCCAASMYVTPGAQVCPRRIGKQWPANLYKGSYLCLFRTCLFCSMLQSPEFICRMYV